MFEYDPAKSAANKAKHGIDFDEAQALWDDDKRIEIVSRVVLDEERYLVVGTISGKIWTAIVTDRLGAVRMISVRRARRNEEEAYGRRRAH